MSPIRCTCITMWKAACVYEWLCKCVHGFSYDYIISYSSIGLLHAHVHVHSCTCTCTCMYYGLSRLRANNMSGNEGLLKVVGSEHDSTVCDTPCVCACVRVCPLSASNWDWLLEELKCVHAYEGVRGEDSKREREREEDSRLKLLGID